MFTQSHYNKCIYLTNFYTLLSKAKILTFHSHVSNPTQFYFSSDGFPHLEAKLKVGFGTNH